MNGTGARENAFRRIASAGALSAGAAVALGAFGAHGLRGTISPEMLAAYESGVRYQMYHSIALVAAGVTGLSVSSCDRRLLLAASCAFGAGIVLFSGSLYALALSGLRGLGAVTPAGGVAFIAAWVMFAVALIRPERP